MMKKISQLSCLFCVNSSTSVKKFKITEEYGGGNTIRYDLTNFLGYQIESYLRDEDVLCSNCMNFFEHMAYTKRRLIDFLRDRDNTADVKMKGFNDIWKGFTKFAGTLVKINPNDASETWEPESCSRPQTPNPLIYKYSEVYDHEYERRLMRRENMRSHSVAPSEGMSETDSEIQKLFKRKRRGYNWSKRKGELKSRTLSRSYDTSRASSIRRRRSMMSSRCTSTTSRPTSKRQRRVFEGRPLKTRAVSRIELSYVEEMEKVEAERFFCEQPDCPIYSQCLSLDNYTLHRVLDHHEIARYNCSLCTNVYFTRRHLEIHNKVHDEIMYCFQCGAELEGLQKFQEHVSEHQIYSVNCLYCLKSFLSKKDLSNHVTKDHKKEKVRAHEKSCKTFETVSYKQLSMRNSSTNEDFKSITLFNEGTPSPQISDVDFTSGTPIMEISFSVDSPRSAVNLGSQAIGDELDISDMEIQDTNEENSLIIDDSFIIEENPVVIEEVTSQENNETPQGIVEAGKDSISEGSNSIELEQITDNVSTTEDVAAISENVEIEENNREEIPVIKEPTAGTSGLSTPRILDVYEINEIILGNKSSVESDVDSIAENWQLTRMRPVVVLEPLTNK